MLPLKINPPNRVLGIGFILAIATAVLVMLPSLSSATIVNASATPFYGERQSATLTIDDESQAGSLVITLAIDPNAQIGGLRSFYAQISDESLLPGLSVSGPDITSSRFSANSVNDFGNNDTAVRISANPACSSSGCDFGIEIGTSESQAEQIQSITFVLSHISEALTVGLFTDESFALRINGLSRMVNGKLVRGLTSKLAGTVVVPEPTTAMLMLIGFTGLSFAGRRSQIQ